MDSLLNATLEGLSIEVGRSLESRRYRRNVIGRQEDGAPLRAIEATTFDLGGRRIRPLTDLRGHFDAVEPKAVLIVCQMVVRIISLGLHLNISYLRHG